jgi:hypothetical protein
LAPENLHKYIMHRISSFIALSKQTPASPKYHRPKTLVYLFNLDFYLPRATYEPPQLEKSVTLY